MAQTQSVTLPPYKPRSSHDLGPGLHDRQLPALPAALDVLRRPAQRLLDCDARQQDRVGDLRASRQQGCVGAPGSLQARS